MEPISETKNNIDLNESDLLSKQDDLIDLLKDSNSSNHSNNLDKLDLLDYEQIIPLNKDKTFETLNFTNKKQEEIISSSFENMFGKVDLTSSRLIDWNTNPFSLNLNYEENDELNSSNKSSFDWVKNIDFTNISKIVDSKLSSINSEKQEDKRIINENSILQKPEEEKIIFTIKDENGIRKNFEALSLCGGRIILYKDIHFRSVSEWIYFVKNGVFIPVNNKNSGTSSISLNEDTPSGDINLSNELSSDFNFSIHKDQSSTEDKGLFYSQPFTDTDLININNGNIVDIFPTITQSQDDFSIEDSEYDFEYSNKDKLFADSDDFGKEHDENDSFPTTDWEIKEPIFDLNDNCEIDFCNEDSIEFNNNSQISSTKT